MANVRFQIWGKFHERIKSYDQKMVRPETKSKVHPLNFLIWLRTDGPMLDSKYEENSMKESKFMTKKRSDQNPKVKCTLWIFEFDCVLNGQCQISNMRKMPWKNQKLWPKMVRLKPKVKCTLLIFEFDYILIGQCQIPKMSNIPWKNQKLW